MGSFDSIEEILAFAISGEEAAARFYNGLADKMSNAATAEIFRGFAKEEEGHKAKLEGIKKGEAMPEIGEVPNLAIADYAVAEKPSDNMDYQSALILAMKQEKAAFKLYSDIAAKVEDAQLRKVFLLLAQEEAKHRLRFEIEYDDQVLTEN